MPNLLLRSVGMESIMEKSFILRAMGRDAKLNWHLYNKRVCRYGYYGKE